MNTEEIEYGLYSRELLKRGSRKLGTGTAVSPRGKLFSGSLFRRCRGRVSTQSLFAEGQPGV